jgi:hypothetical protein
MIKGVLIVWPFEKHPVEPCLQIGRYCLDMNIDGLEGLYPLSSEELVALDSAISFEGEQILHAPGEPFMGIEWDTILGTVNGQIYKIAIQWSGARSEAGRLYRQFVIECTRRYGNGKSHTVTSWDASNGNLVLHSVNMGGEASVNFFVTSHRIRNFKRIA